jgi:hypothetical protein
MAIVLKIRQAPDHMSDYDIDTIALMSLEIFYRALDFQRALMFIQDSATKRMSVRFGYGHICIGALYADRDTEGLPMSESEHRYLSMLRNQLVLSIKYRQKTV